MNTHKVATALNTISMAFAELAEALTEQPVAAGEGAARNAPAPPPDDYAELAEEIIPDEGHEAVCPIHRKPYRPGDYGPYCAEKGTDPAWTNPKGYCRLTPKNAAQYLRIKAAA